MSTERVERGATLPYYVTGIQISNLCFSNIVEVSNEHTIYSQYIHNLNEFLLKQNKVLEIIDQGPAFDHQFTNMNDWMNK